MTFFYVFDGLNHIHLERKKLIFFKDFFIVRLSTYKKNMSLISVDILTYPKLINVRNNAIYIDHEL